jgi:hypothetical protein
MTRTGLQVITDALKLLGVVAGHEVPTSAEQSDAFARLNELIDSWGTHAQTLLVSRRDVIPLVPAQQVYTLGPGGTFDVTLPVPLALDDVAYVLAGAPETEVFLQVGTDRAAVATPQKALTGALPTLVNYSRTHGYGELYVWPVPTQALDLVIYWAQPLAQFPDLVTPVALAAGYARALRCNLAVDLAPEFGRQLDPQILFMARESLADVKRQNFPLVEIGIDTALTGAGSYNILTDT